MSISLTPIFNKIQFIYWIYLSNKTILQNFISRKHQEQRLGRFWLWSSWQDGFHLTCKHQPKGSPGTEELQNYKATQNKNKYDVPRAEPEWSYHVRGGGLWEQHPPCRGQAGPWRPVSLPGIPGHVTAIPGYRRGAVRGLWCQGECQADRAETDQSQCWEKNQHKTVLLFFHILGES